MSPLPFAVAKELCDAGWVQPDFTVGDSDGKVWLQAPSTEPWPEGEPELVYSPSLDELIEACPRTIEITPRRYLSFILNFGTFGWRAGYIDSGFIDWEIHGDPSETAQKAVAVLWLALRKEGRV